MKNKINLFILFLAGLFIFNLKVQAEEYNFSYTGNMQEFVVPSDGYYKFEAWGAAGGRNLSQSSYSDSESKLPGYGAYATGTAFLREGTKFYIYVGGKGSDGVIHKTVPGGWNGGGDGDHDYSEDEASGGGGGATDFRLVGGTWDSFTSLASRVLVAAGGGGASYSATGGYGGALVGGKATYSEGGTQTTGYAFGIGQDGKCVDYNVDVAGGGGGYYGGYAKSSGAADVWRANGAGGSSFISGYKGCNAISKDSTIANIIHTGSSEHYSELVFKDTNMIAGNASMPKYTGTGNMTGNSSNGYAKITKLDSGDAITGISLNGGHALQNNIYDPYEYTLLVKRDTPATGDLTLETIGSPRSIVGDKDVNLTPGATNTITLTTSTGEIQVYKVNVELQKGHVNDLDFDYLELEFNQLETEYTGSIPYSVKNLIPIIQKDDGVTVTVEGNTNLKSGENVITVTAHEDGYDDTVYTIKVHKATYSDTTTSTEFLYTGGPQTFEVPQTGYYEIEAWGASGGKNVGDAGNASRMRVGGLGGYTKGRIFLEAGTKLYVYVGGKGTDAKVGTTVAGGYNGGGKGDYDHQDDEASGAGGGATDIRLTSGTWNNFESLKSRIMVAAGGGGASYQMQGGYGGGLEGQDTIYSKGGTQTTGYAFGIGQDGKFVNTNVDVAGGGGGYYGGYANSSGKANTYLAGGAGGSSFVSGCENCNAIASNSTSSKIIHTGTPNHYSGYVFDHIIIRAGNEIMPNQAGDSTQIGNNGKGFAKITYIGSTSITDIDVEGAIVTDTITEDKNNFNVLIPSSPFETNIKITTNSETTIIGDGAVTLTEGKPHTIVLMDEKGNVKTYTLTPYTETPTLNNITIDEYPDLVFSPNLFEYDFTVDNMVTALHFNVFAENATYEIIGANELEVGNNKVTVKVKDAVGSTSTYTFNVEREFKVLTQGFSLTGTPQTYTAAKSGYYIIEAWGAGGGMNRSQSKLKTGGGDAYSNYGGAGGYTKGKIYLEKGTTLYIYVGGRGNDAVVKKIVAGGFNGGGRGDYDHADDEAAGAGGGASDIRLVGGACDDFASLKSRIMVAGGGGGAGYGINRPGGYAGGLEGQNTKYSTGGKQNSGYAFGKGQDGVYVNSNVDVAGGGGGYYGGNSKSSGKASVYETSGAGGSSFVSGCVGCNAIAESSTATKIVHTGSSTHYSGMKFTDIVMYSGNEQMPSYINPKNTMKGNAGDGYVKITALSDIDESKLITLDIDKGTMTPAFNENTHEYDVVFDADDTEIDITATTNNVNAKIEGTGHFNVPAGDSTHLVTVTDEAGTISTYTFNFQRGESDNPFLKDILVNGISLEGFQPAKNVYNKIIIPYYLDFINVEAIPSNAFQTVTGDGIITFNDTDTARSIIITTSESAGTPRSYILNFEREKTTKIKDINSKTLGVKFDFDPKTEEYVLNVNENIFAVDFEVIPYYKTAEITITGNDYVEDGSIITITSHLDGLEDTVYTMKVKTTTEAEVDEKFEATGAPIPFTAPFKGYYKVELWGAQGGKGMVDGSSRNEGGYGSYTSGTILLDRGETLQLYIGKKGADAASITSCTGGIGGWNGGGNGGNDSNCDSAPEPGAGGGGATDIRLLDGAYNNAKSLYSRLMVAAGGSGGGYYHAGIGGGGLTGYKPSGSSSKYPTQTAGNALGTGAIGSNNLAGSSGSGGGYYGGYNVTGGYYSGGSGSSYISGHLGSIGTTDSGKSVSTSANTKEDSYNYSGKYFFDTKMIDGYGYVWSNVKEYQDFMPSKDNAGDYYDIGVGNKGDGAARIKLLQAISSNNYLASLDVTVNGTPIDIGFAPGKENYDDIPLLNSESTVVINAKAKDSGATVINLGKHNIPPNGYDVPITVTASDGSQRIYTLTFNREGLTDPHPSNIKINKMSSYVCSIDGKYCNYKFDVNNPGPYQVLVPFTISNIELLAIPVTAYQDVDYYVYDGTDYVKTEGNTGKVNLKSGLNKYRVDIWSENKENVISYYYEITRDPEGNTNVESITITSPITDPPLDLNFDPSIYEYTLSVPNSTIGVEFDVKTENPDAFAFVTGNTRLRLGMNDAYIIVYAPNGETSTYIVHIYKEADSNVFLESLTPSTGTLNPDFDKFINDYTINVASNVNEVTIDAIPESGSATVDIEYPEKLDSGVNVIKVIVKNGESENIYTVNVVKSKSNNPNLSSLEVSGYELDIPFDPEITEYHVKIPKGVTSVPVLANPVDSTTRITKRGNSNLIYNSNEITITCTAEDKTTKVYYIYAEKDVSNNSNLAGIDVTDLDGNKLLDKEGNEIKISPEFSTSTTDYTMSVPAEIDNILVTATAEDAYATITGNGKYALTTGENTVTLEVTSEQGTKTTYTLKVTKEKSDDNSLKEILNNQNSSAELVGDEYVINVQYDVKDIKITAVANNPKAVVSGNGTYSLKTGDNNIIPISITSESGKIANYTIRVVRDYSHNDDLSFIFAKEGGLSPVFRDTTIYYTVYVPNETEALTLTIETEDPDATYKVEGNSNFVVGENEVKIIVTAPDGKNTKTYYLNVYRQAAIDGETLLLAGINIDSGKLTPDFDSGVNYYEVSVPNTVTSINLSGVLPDDSPNSIIGEGVYPLKVGKNGLTLSVKSPTSGIRNDYQIVVNRAKSNDATLSNLVVKGHIFSPEFNKNTHAYSLTTSGTALEFTSIIPTEKDATYTVSGNENFKSGTNTVTISVTPPSGNTTLKKDYVLTVTKTASQNNNLASLEVKGHTLTPVFHKGVTVYTLTVGEDTNSVDIKVVAEDSGAVVRGSGLVKLEPGENKVPITVIAEDASEKIYNIVITREQSNNNFLSSLLVSEGELDPVFDKEKNNYTVQVPYTTSEITIVGTTEENGATTTGFGTYNLNTGDNKFDIVVTSAAGEDRVYTVTVTRGELYSSLLESLEVKNYPLNDTFDKEYFEYYIDVPNETTSIEVNAVPEMKNATVVVTGNNPEGGLIVGMNIVNITVTTHDSGSTSTYTLYVNRQLSANNKLKTIEIDGYDLTPSFAPDTLSYSVTVPNDVKEVDFSSEVSDVHSTISGIDGASLTVFNDTNTSVTGKVSLSYGSNKLLMKVKSPLGIVRTYTVNIERTSSTDATLASLKVTYDDKELPLNPTFDPATDTYNVEVGAAVKFVNIVAMPNDTDASVTGIGVKGLSKDMNTYEIKVTSVSNETKTYTVNINRKLSSNNNVTDIIPSVGSLNPAFDPAIKEYSINAGDSDLIASFDVKTEDVTAKVTGAEQEAIIDGKNTRVITVTAENGDENVYTIYINKESASEARLSELKINGYDFTKVEDGKDVKVEFDKDTFTYNVKVSASKTDLYADEITATAIDYNATINKMGNITLKKGIINIYTIEVIARDGYTTETYTLNITLDSEDYSLTSDVYNIKREDVEIEHVIGITSGTDMDTFKNNFKNDKTMLHVYDETGATEILDTTSLISTGMVIRLQKDDYIYDKLRIIVRGDVNKDGRADLKDQMSIISYLGEIITYDNYSKIAGDVNLDGTVNIKDQMKLISYLGEIEGVDINSAS